MPEKVVEKVDPKLGEIQSQSFVLLLLLAQIQQRRAMYTRGDCNVESGAEIVRQTHYKLLQL